LQQNVMLHTAHTHQMAIFTLNMEIGKKIPHSINQSINNSWYDNKKWVLHWDNAARNFSSFCI